MEQVWKKASLFTQLSALFEGLDDNPKSSALRATETLTSAPTLRNFSQQLLFGKREQKQEREKSV